MQVLKSRDVEDALRLDLKALLQSLSFSVIAPPIPDTLGANLPLVVVFRLGGGRSNLVIEEHDVSFDIYAAKWSTAQDAANTVVAAFVSLRDSDNTASGVHWLDASVNALPYNNPDPRHSDIPRVSFSAMVTCRPEVIDL